MCVFFFLQILSRYLDSAVCNNVIVGLFGDLLNPSEFHVWDAKTGKELSVLFSGFDENCFLCFLF